MSEFLDLLRRQVADDLAALPARLRAARSPLVRLRRLQSAEEVRRAAKRALPRVIFDFVDGAAGDELAARRNRRDFEALEVHPRYLVDVSSVTAATTVLGEPVSTPILGAPTGLSGLVHPSGEVGLARAAHAAGSIYVLSAMASYTIEEVAAAAPGPKWFQLYMWKDRGFVLDLLQRARAAGYRALMLTVDGPRTGARERDVRNGFGIPPRVTLRSVAGGLRHPAWTTGFVRGSRLVVANAPPGRERGDVREVMAYFAAQFDPGLTWTDVAWLRNQWPGPIVVKGLLSAEDAAAAAAAAVDAIVVSNHGGRQLDEAPSTISVLPRLVDAAGDGVEVYLDSGVRRGGDVLKALALGARACLVGRPFVFGLAVAGEAGARHVLDLLTRELELALALSGCLSIGDVATASLLDPSSS